MQNKKLANFATTYNLVENKTINESPFVETNGVLTFKAECKNPDFFARSSFVIILWGQVAVVDHFVLMFPDPETLTKYADELVKLGAQITEGPRQWPDEFCPDSKPFPPDLSMYFLTALMPVGGMLVLLAPHQPNDQLDRFYKERGTHAVPHVAVRVEDVRAAANYWRKQGFIPLSSHPQDDGSLCQWFLRNWAGQIIELIHRQPGGRETFSCQNIRDLRLSEVGS